MNLTPSHLRHLGRRLWGSWRATPLNEKELAWVRTFLRDGEFTVWISMAWRDQRHAFQVAQRFVTLTTKFSPSLDSTLDRDAMAAALLHDVGKATTPLSTGQRVVATLVGGRTQRFRSYLDHEAVGYELCRQVGSTDTTLDLLAGRGDPLLVALLRQADEI